MATYLMFGKYNPQSLREISKARTDEATKVIKQCGGELKQGYALLGSEDLVFITELPSTEQAMKASVMLTKATGIGFTCAPAVSVEQFDKLMA